MILRKYIYESLKYLMRSRLIIYPYIKRVEKFYSMSSCELLEWKQKRFLTIFRRAYDRSSFYHEFYKKSGINRADIQSIDDLKKLPVITKSIVRQHSNEMLTVPRIFVMSAHTSGTTGTPLKLFQDFHSIWLFQAYLYVYRLKCGFKYGHHRLISLRGHLDRNTASLKVHVSKTLFLSSYAINNETIFDYYEQINKFKPRAIEGYPSSLYTLALFFSRNNLKVTIPIAFTSSETLLDSQRRLIEEQLNTEIFDNYGLTEKTISLLESKSHTGYFESPGYSINEYVTDGEICTSLLSSSFPLIRYKSDDIVEYDPQVDSLEPLPVIVHRILGRMDDYIVCKDGTHVTRVDFIESGNNFKACQWIQNQKGKVTINIVPDKSFSEKDEKYIVDETLKRVGVGNMDITIRLVSLDKLTYTSRGKFKLVVRNYDD